MAAVQAASVIAAEHLEREAEERLGIIVELVPALTRQQEGGWSQESAPLHLQPLL